MSFSLQHREQELEVQSSKIFCGSYKPNKMYFEIYEEFRKLLQTAVFVLVPGFAAQAIAMLILLAIAITVITWQDPYLRLEHSIFAQVCLWNVFVVVFISLLGERSLVDPKSNWLSILLLIWLLLVPIQALLIEMWTRIDFAKCWRKPPNKKSALVLDESLEGREGANALKQAQQLVAKEFADSDKVEAFNSLVVTLSNVMDNQLQTIHNLRISEEAKAHKLQVFCRMLEETNTLSLDLDQKDLLRSQLLRENSKYPPLVVLEQKDASTTILVDHEA
jgi:hypothetical protein